MTYPGSNPDNNVSLPSSPLPSSPLQDLIALKRLDNFSFVECEEYEEGESVATSTDDFTVETSLEDLEFGFSIVTSTQKVQLELIYPGGRGGGRTRSMCMWYN